MININDLNIG